jgi:predicted nucleotidyltransferase
MEAKSNSDLDLMVELKENEKYSMFDLLDIAHAIEIKINRKVDLVEKGQLKDFALESAIQNLQQIYG